jgi:hypothetical protein
MFYYTANAIKELFKKNDLELFDIKFSDVHGGSALFIAGKKGKHTISENLKITLDNEKLALKNMQLFKSFKFNIENSKIAATKYISERIKDGKKIIAYGAPAKAFTVYAYYGLSNNEIEFCIDTTPEKQGKIFPQFNIPIFGEEKLKNSEYDIVIVNAWNYKDEIINKSKDIFKEGTRLLFLIPQFEEFTV